MVQDESKFITSDKSGGAFLVCYIMEYNLIFTLFVSKR